MLKNDQLSPLWRIDSKRSEIDIARGCRGYYADAFQGAAGRGPGAGSIEVELDLATCEHHVACESYALDPVYAVYAFEPQLAKGRALARTLVLDLCLAPGLALVLAWVLALARALALVVRWEFPLDQAPEQDSQAEGRTRRPGGACAKQRFDFFYSPRAPPDE